MTLTAKLLGSMHNAYPDNIDLIRFPQERKSPRLRDRIRASAAKIVRFMSRHERCLPAQALPALEEIYSQQMNLEAVYELLADSRSRQVLIDLLAYRVLGGAHIKLVTNNAHYAGVVRSVLARYPTVHPVYPFTPDLLPTLNLNAWGFPITLRAHQLNAICTFLLEQYKYAQGRMMIRAEPGDIIIDGGACWGDTALYFAHLAGPIGHVYSLEFVEENLKLLRSNLWANPSLASHVTVIPAALWDTTNARLSAHGDGPGTRVVADDDVPGNMATLTIDDLVERENIGRVDFLKLDIEGAECRALHGARRTLERHRPKLAIAVYHSLSDLTQVPLFLQELHLGYRFYLDHFTIHSEETVMFAVAT